MWSILSIVSCWKAAISEYPYIVSKFLNIDIFLEAEDVNIFGSRHLYTNQQSKNHIQQYQESELSHKGESKESLSNSHGMPHKESPLGTT